MKLLRVLVVLALTTTSLAADIPSTFFGLHVLHAVNGTTPWPSDQFGTLRLWDSGVDWSEINTSQGYYNWANFDRWMTLAQQNNVQVVYTFGRVPSWANGGQGTMVPPTNMQYWDDFVRAVATRSAGHVHYWELWNEPNDLHFYTGDLNTLMTMVQHAYQIIKSVDPTAVILTPSPTWTTTSAYDWMNTWLQMGGGNYADIIAFHGYVNTSPEEIYSLAGKMRTVMVNNGQSGKQLWDTEASWSSSGDCTTSICDQDQQAAFLVRHYMLHLSQGVDRYLWYSWDNPWGTLWSATSGVLKPGIAYGNVYNWLVGASLSQPCTLNNGTWTCTITRANGYQGLVIWNPTATVSYASPTQYRQYRDIYGNTTQIPSNGVISVNFMPLLLETTSNTATVACQSSLQVSVATPTNGASVTSPVRFVASATSGCPVNAMRIYVDNQSAYTTYASSLDTSLSLSTGSHYVVVQAWDSTGAVAKSALNINVGQACSAPTVNIAWPGAGYTLPDPLTISATANSGCGIKQTAVLVDGSVVSSVAGGSVNVSASPATGNHSITVQTWDNNGTLGQSSVSVGAVNLGTCYVSTTPKTITVCYPLANTVVPTAMRVVAGATGTNGIKAMRIYVDNNNMYTVNASALDTVINLAPGTHYLVVQAWDGGGGVFKTGRYVTVK